ncbi:MAG: hypothetical protein DI558_11790 [Corynebacterium propinquum]|nr:MAG: hypothetical protein DI558_11790 [Corynebacterium propinquum]
MVSVVYRAIVRISAPLRVICNLLTAYCQCRRCAVNVEVGQERRNVSVAWPRLGLTMNAMNSLFGALPMPGSGGAATPPPEAALPALVLSERQSDRGRLISHSRLDPAHGAFDMMRTRVAQALADRGWSRIAVTSPTKNCGKTFVSANLALSLARRRSLRVGLLDLDLRLPSLAHVFGVTAPGEIGRLLEGEPPLAAHFRRLGDGEFWAGFGKKLD